MNFKNWQTTIAGAILLLGGIVLYCIKQPVEASICVVAGVGLLRAKDGTTTGVGADAKTLHDINKEK